MGLIRGATDECAIIIGQGQVQNGPLRFSDEFVRHKVLDLIGDLALAGHRIWGRVVAERAGHAMHTALLRRIRILHLDCHDFIGMRRNGDSILVFDGERGTFGLFQQIR